MPANRAKEQLDCNKFSIKRKHFLEIMQRKNQHFFLYSKKRRIFAI